METITIPKETFEKMRDALVNSLTFLLSAQSSPQLWHDTMNVVQEANKALQESALQRVADLGQEIEAGGWQPIETAPKNGMRILLFNRYEKHEWSAVAARWFADGWWDGDFYIENPTAWMPLSTPPKAKP